MAHPAQIEYCKSIKLLYPELFKGKTVLDCGSLDINGNNRYLFEDCEYIGIDIVEGRNVDVRHSAHQIRGEYEVVISTEMLEHDRYWQRSLENMAKITKKLLLITTAGHLRQPHGTYNNLPHDSPATNSFYRNLKLSDFDSIIPLFRKYDLVEEGEDIYFYGIK
jgi:hypothetical protein